MSNSYDVIIGGRNFNVAPEGDVMRLRINGEDVILNFNNSKVELVYQDDSPLEFFNLENLTRESFQNGAEICVICPDGTNFCSDKIDENNCIVSPCGKICI